MKPIVVDLFCGLGGWTKGFLAEGYHCIGFDIERHQYWLPESVPENEGGGKGTRPVEKRGWTQGCAVSLGMEGATAKPRTRLAEYPGELVLQDVHTLHGRQFKDAACIVASPPCQEFSYMAMPWKRAKQIAAALRGDGEFPEDYKGSRTVAQLKALFDACFRIQREASEAAGRHIPMVVENVKGAQPWVGRANANYGSFYLWGDVRSVGGRIVPAHRVEFGAAAVKATLRKNGGNGSWWAIEHGTRTSDGTYGCNPVRGEGVDGRKVPMNFHEYEKTGKPGRSFQSAAVEATRERSGLHGDESDVLRNLELAMQCAGVKSAAPHAWFNDHKKAGVDIADDDRLSRTGSKSAARKAASAMIAEIPFELSSWVARCFKPSPTDRLRAGYDPERENGQPRRSAAWNRAQGWCDALMEEALEWRESRAAEAKR